MSHTKATSSAQTLSFFYEVVDASYYGSDKTGLTKLLHVSCLYGSERTEVSQDLSELHLYEVPSFVLSCAQKIVPALAQVQVSSQVWNKADGAHEARVGLIRESGGRAVPVKAQGKNPLQACLEATMRALKEVTRPAVAIEPVRNVLVGDGRKGFSSLAVRPLRGHSPQ